MITDKKTIQQLQFRSDLPRLNKQDLFIFAQLESEEQKKSDEERMKLIIQAYAQLIKDESSAPLFDNIITSAEPLAYTFYKDSDEEYEWLECVYKIEGDRNKYTSGKMKIYKKSFVYFVMSNLRSIPSVNIPQGWLNY